MNNSCEVRKQQEKKAGQHLLRPIIKQPVAGSTYQMMVVQSPVLPSLYPSFIIFLVLPFQCLVFLLPAFVIPFLILFCLVSPVVLSGYKVLGSRAPFLV